MSQTIQRNSYVFRVAREKNPHFVGRESLLADIRQTLLSGQAAALTALHGMGGVGKTQLAAEYAYAHATEYRAVWWLNAETEAMLANDLAALAQALALPKHDAREIPVIVAAVLRWLNDHADWLLIYDNANDAAGIRAYLPTAHRGHVIVTSRDPNWRGLALPLEIKTLDAEAGAQFLIERTGQSDATTARELSDVLGGLPLALEQAGAYCETTGEALAAYLRLFRQRARDLLRRNQPANYPATVATTWEISFEAAQRECTAAAGLLNLLAFCAPEPLPLAMLQNDIARVGETRHRSGVISWLKAKLNNASKSPDNLVTAFKDEMVLADAIAALRHYSLLTRQNDTVTMHRLVQLVARERLAETEQQRWAEAALLMVNAAFPFESQDVRTWNDCVQLLPHAHAVTALADRWQLAAESTGRLVNQMGAYFFGRGQYAEAQQSFERALRLAEAAFGPDHTEVAIRVNNLGNVYYLRDLAGARQRFERALRINEAAFGPDHPSVALRVNNLGSVLHDLGELAEARKCFERALRIDEAAFGPDHPSVARNVNNLGLLLQALGELAEARKCFERALHIDEAAFGPDHPNVAIRVNNLGSVLKDLGDLAGARQCGERALRIFTATLGAEHPSTILTRKNLATLGEG